MFNNSGVCIDKCPPLEIYIPNKYQLVENKVGKYTYGSTCVQECPGKSGTCHSGIFFTPGINFSSA